MRMSRIRENSAYLSLNKIANVPAPQPKKGLSIISGIVFMYINILGSFKKLVIFEN